MLLKHKPSGDLIEVLRADELFNPCRSAVIGRIQAGEEVQDPESFSKSELIFPSGESLPNCWLDAHYREHELRKSTIAQVI